MWNIAIVEDEDSAASVLSGFIEKYSSERGEQFKIDRYKDAVSFLLDYTPKHAVVFMDIQMPYRDGMSAAVELRKLDKTVSIVFITNLVQYAQKGYDVDAVAYIVKPVAYYDFAMKFRKALDIYVLNEKHDFTINTAEGLRRISTEKLMYVEIVKHRLYYHMVDSVIERTGVIGKAEDELKKYGFLRCNQGYLVNPRFIVAMNGNLLRVGTETLTVSRPRKKKFMTELADWYAGLDKNI